MKNLFICRSDWGNPGDLWSSPLHYVDKSLRGPLVDTSNLSSFDPQIEFDNIIIGGGALFTSAKIAKQIIDFLSKVSAKNIILWGVGVSAENAGLFSLVDNSKVKGVRDWLPGTEFEQHWVPCASVLHPCIENNMSHVATKDFLVIDHWKRKPITLDIHHTRLVNNPCTIEQIVSTIADHNYVLTSSYHVAYWATLLKKKVIVISDPWQFKFDHFRHPPVLAEKFSWGLLDRARLYPEAYKQCLSANKQMLKTLRELPTQDIVVFDSIDDPGSPTDQSV